MFNKETYWNLNVTHNNPRSQKIQLNGAYTHTHPQLGFSTRNKGGKEDNDSTVVLKAWSGRLHLGGWGRDYPDRYRDHCDGVLHRRREIGLNFRKSMWTSEDLQPKRSVQFARSNTIRRKNGSKGEILAKRT